MVDEKEILSKLVVQEKDAAKDLERLVEEASKHFRIENPSGKVMFVDYAKLSDRQRIAALLTGTYFAYKLGLKGTFDLKIGDIAQEVGRPVTALSGPIKELVKRGYVDYSATDKKYRAAYHRVNDIVSGVLSDKKK